MSDPNGVHTTDQPSRFSQQVAQKEEDNEVEFVGTSPVGVRRSNGVDISSAMNVFGGMMGEHPMSAMNGGDPALQAHPNGVLPYPGQTQQPLQGQHRAGDPVIPSQLLVPQMQRQLQQQQQQQQQQQKEQLAAAQSQFLLHQNQLAPSSLSTTTPRPDKTIEVYGFGQRRFIPNGHGQNGLDGSGSGTGMNDNALAGPSGYAVKAEATSTANATGINNSAAPIDLTTDEPTPPPSFAATTTTAASIPVNANDKILPPANRQPLCIGSIDSMALILYPSEWMQKGSITDALISTGDVRRDLKGDEWLKVRLKYRRPKGRGDECINIITVGQNQQTGQSQPIGVVNETMLDLFRDVLEKGLARLEGYVKRGDISNMFTAPMNILIFTLPSNVKYISDRMIDKSQWLDHPLPSYIPSNHTDSPPYLNPHTPPPEGYRVSKKARTDALLAANRGGMAMGKTIEVQREQVDQVFKSLKGGDELEETDPGQFIKTKLFGHQKKAITFLLQREQEPSVIKAAAAAAAAKAAEVVDIDEEDMSEESKKKLRKEKKLIKKRGLNSLWEPVESGGKIRGWRNLVTEQTHSGKDKPADMRGAILADDMGLGKTLSIVSLIASTLKTARKFGQSEISRHDSDDSDSDDEPELSPSHFAGATFDMPETTEDGGGSGNGTRRKRLSKKEKHAVQRLEAKHRASRLAKRTRATLLVCPLSTVSNWEDQIKEHWNGEVMVMGGSSPAPTAEEFKSAGSDVLKVYVYHGAARKGDPNFLAQFDIVITTFSTLQTEFSKQLKSVSESQGVSQVGSQVGSAAASPAAEQDDDDDVMEVDEDGAPAIKEGQKLEVETERMQMEKAEKAASKGKRKRGADEYDLAAPKSSKESVSPLQAVEWFRVVLDEAHFIKDASTMVSRAACYLEAERRIALTGTPIQNKLDDVWALIKFLRFHPFDDKTVWTTFILGLAKAGNSLGVARLQTILKHCTLRRTKESTNANGERILNLPARREEIREIEFSPEEREIYDKYFQRSKEEFIAMQKESGKTSYVNVLHQLLQLRQICDHWRLPSDAAAEDELADDDAIAEAEESMDFDEVRKAIEADQRITFRRALAAATSLKTQGELKCCNCEGELELPEIAKVEEELEEEPARKGKGKKKAKLVGNPVVTKCLHIFCLPCLKSSINTSWPKVSNTVVRHCPICNTPLLLIKDVVDTSPTGQENPPGKTGKRRVKSKVSAEKVEMSAKMKSLLGDLMQFSRGNPASSNYDQWAEDVVDTDENGKVLATKTVVFSQWTTMLDHIENMLAEANICHARLDGTMRREERAEAMDKLRNDPACEVLLVSLRAGGVGLNLTAATRCYLIDPYWNPSVENQAVDRIHRLGQKRPIVSTKFIIKETIEGRMLEVQKRKAELAKLSLSQTISKKDLHERRLEDLKMLFG